MTYDPNIGFNVMTVPLIAGKDEVVGRVDVWLQAQDLHLRYTSDGDYLIEQTQLGLGAQLDEFPLTPNGCPKVGQLPWGEALQQGAPEVELVVDLVEAGLDGLDELILAAHAELSSQQFGETGAWAEGESFPGCNSPARQLRVDLQALRGLILWNKLGSVAEVTHSEVGPDGVIVGSVSFFPTQHGDGFRPDLRLGDRNIPDNYVEFEGLELGPQGCIEFWYAPDWSNFAVGHVVDILYYGIAEDVFNNHIVMAFNDWQNRLNTAVVEAFVSAGVAVQLPAPVPGWSTVQPIHVALSWDGSAPNIADRLRVFVEGAPLPSTSHYGDPNFESWLPGARLRLGSRLDSGDWNRHNWEGLDGEMDNIKVWNYPKADFSDRFVE